MNVPKPKVIAHRVKARVLHHYGNLKEVHAKMDNALAAAAVTGTVIGVFLAFEFRLNRNYEETTRSFMLGILLGGVLGLAIVDIVVAVFGSQGGGH